MTANNEPRMRDIEERAMLDLFSSMIDSVVMEVDAQLTPGSKHDGQNMKHIRY